MGFFSRVTGCLGRLIFLVIAVAIAVAAWLYRDRLSAAWDALRDQVPAAGAERVASPELAANARARIEAVTDGRAPGVSLTGDEIEALLRHEYAGLLPAYVDSPRVQIQGDRLRITARIPAERIPRTEGLDALLGFLPDTAEISASGQLIPLDDERVAFAINGLEAARVPLPDRLIAPLLQALGRRDEPGLASDAVAVPLPPGVRAAYVRADSLVLLGRGAPRAPER
jgi:hypothetical protein